MRGTLQASNVVEENRSVEMTGRKDTILEVGGTSGDGAQCYIYKVPVKFRSENEKDTYEPRIVSIGPYHHKLERLKITDEHKQIYLKDLILRDGSGNMTQSVVSSNIRNLESQARACYAEPIDSSIDFVNMMVLDGSFILELLFKFSEKDQKTIKKKTQNDPIFGSTWMIYSLRRDLVLLENQLPFIVLEKLFELCKYSNPKKYTLSGFITTFFDSILPSVIPARENSEDKGHHILDLLRNYLLPKKQLPNPAGGNLYFEYTHNATDLWESGVSFKEKKSSDGLLEVTFSEHRRLFWPNLGVLEIPKFYYGESWRILLPNLIALEQCRSDYEDKITSYVILIDSLIDSPNDVKILRNNGILDGLFHEDEKVATEINNLVKGIFVDDYYYDEVSNRVNKYCKRKYNKIRATAKHNYFDTPCKTISFLAALLLLLLTLLQTIFTVFPYFRPAK